MVAQSNNIDFDKWVGKYIEIRDYIKKRESAHKEELKQYKEMLDKINSYLLQCLTSTNQQSAATIHGTVYKTSKKSASVEDMTLFWTYVVTTGDFDILDKRANVTAVEEYIEKNQQLPPGVKFNVLNVVGVKRK